MTEVVQSIHRVTEVMHTINTNAAEQRDGVAQVNEAVGSLDQMTQQNAALVEQSAAAAHSLHAQSEHLRELVQRFKVQAAAPHYHTRPTRVQAVPPRSPTSGPLLSLAARTPQPASALVE